MGIPYIVYEKGILIRDDEGFTRIPFNNVKKILFTPELKTEENNCPGVITYKNGVENETSFAFGSFYSDSLSFFSPYGYTYRLGNTKRSEPQWAGGLMESYSDVRSIEFY
jgi:hypothetical protein